MIRKFSTIFFLFLIFTVPAFLFCKASEKDSNTNLNTINKDLITENEKIENKINDNKKIIYELLKTNQFNKALDIINNTKKLTLQLGSSDYVLSIQKSIDELEKQLYKQWSVYLEKKAAAAAANNEWNDSLKFASESNKMIAENNIIENNEINQNIQIIEKSKNKISEEEFKQVTSEETLVPEAKEKQFDVKKYFTLAEGYKKNHEYEKARDMLEKILILEPYNYKAMYELKQIYSTISKTGDKRKYMQIKEKLAQTEWGYAVPIKEQISKNDIIPITEIDDNSTKLQKKLDNIIVPKVAFDRASINSVIEFLRNETETLDKEDNIGINIDLRSSNQAIGEIPITLEMANVPLGELIRIICNIAKLNYKVEEHAIIISDVPLDTMILKYIPVKSDIINSIADINNIKEEEELDIETSIDISSEENKTEISPVTIEDQTLLAYFTTRGVPFPPDAAISWDMPSSTLIVKNTPENVKILENLLEEIDISPPLILIEVKLVELTYDKKMGLAFNFKINLSGTGWNMNEFTNPSQTGNDYLNQTGDLLDMLEYSQSPINIGNATGAVDFIVSALEQTKLAETLSTPKIVTKSGSTSYFEMVEKNYYATSWTVEDPEVVYNTVQLGYPTPNFEEMNMGVMLQTTATVSSNNQTIFLDIYPLVKEFLAYDEYDYSATQFIMAIDGTTVSDTQQFQRQLKMPQIINRDIKSKLKINDGDTVVLGGMLKDETTTTRDKYPILGDIPLLGRFFRSEYEVVEQKNLLIFVTTKLVNPDGSLLHKPKPNGLFEFKNI